MSMSLKRGEPIGKLIERAGMDIYQNNTGVVRSTDDSFAVMVTTAFEPSHGDCVSIGIKWPDSDPGVWKVAHFSPARARLIADHLLRHAKRLEASDPGMSKIDWDDD